MNIIEEIVADYNWRSGELAVIKTIPHRYKLDKIHQEMLRTYLVPAIYALWEGFVTNSFQAYIRYINSQKLLVNELDINILTFAMVADGKLNLANPRSDFSKQKVFVEEFLTKINTHINIAPNIPTKSNVNYVIVHRILQYFNLPELEEKYRAPLNKLLKYRNSIAHGERALPVSDDNIDEFTKLVVDMMTDICILIDDGVKMKSYLATSKKGR